MELTGVVVCQFTVVTQVKIVFKSLSGPVTRERRLHANVCPRGTGSLRKCTRLPGPTPPFSLKVSLSKQHGNCRSCDIAIDCDCAVCSLALLDFFTLDSFTFVCLRRFNVSTWQDFIEHQGNCMCCLCMFRVSTWQFYHHGTCLSFYAAERICVVMFFCCCPTGSF